MFDQVPAPPNLPVEPEAKNPTPSPTPSPTATQPASPQGLGPGSGRMRNGIMPPAQQEPEDILSSVGSEMSEAPAPMDASMLGDEDSAGKNNKLRIIMIVLAGIAGMLVLVVGGLFVYRTYFAKDTATLPSVQGEDAVSGESRTGSSAGATPTAPAPAPTNNVQPENPPVVEPTPEPEIPKPEPVGAVATIDTDGDSLPDTREAELKTDPANADTDGDGLSDGEEVRMGTDPLVADTDGDGLSDGDEVRVWKTDPKTKDTDGDGFADGDEVKNGYNPLGQGKLSTIR